MNMKVASAPVSWGITEIEGLRSALPYQQVMDEIAEAGYAGTELGPWGFYPTAPDRLRSELDSRGLSLVASFVDVAIHEPALFDEGRRAVQTVLPLLAELGARTLILSARSTVERMRIAGRVTEPDGLTGAQWRLAGTYLRELAARAEQEGILATFHHHTGTYVETPAEIERLFDHVDPDALGMCLDTGHLVYGGGDIAELIRQYGGVIRHVHLKNVDPDVLKRARTSKMSYLEAVRAGVFCPLDAGIVDIPQVIGALRGLGYDSWLVVEQDIDLSVPGHESPRTGAERGRNYLREAAAV